MIVFNKLKLLYITTAVRVHRESAGLEDFLKAPDGTSNVILSNKRRSNELNPHAHVLDEELVDEIICFTEGSPDKQGESRIFTVTL
jgi:hypothetical protein